MYFSEYHFKSKTMKLKRKEIFFISLDNIKYFACSTWKVPSTAQVNYGKTKHFTRLADINWKPRRVNSQGPCSGTKIAKRCLSNSSLIFCFGVGKKPLISQLLSQMQNRHSKLWNYRHDASHGWWNIAFNRPYSYSQYWTGTSLQCISLHCKLVPVQYSEYEYGLFLHSFHNWTDSAYSKTQQTLNQDETTKPRPKLRAAKVNRRWFLTWQILETAAPRQLTYVPQLSEKMPLLSIKDTGSLYGHLCFHVVDHASNCYNWQRYPQGSPLGRCFPIRYFWWLLDDDSLIPFLCLVPSLNTKYKLIILRYT